MTKTREEIIFALQNIEKLCNEKMGLWEGISLTYLPLSLVDVYEIREMVEEALTECEE